MILVCPECSVQYEIPTALPEGGSRVRCTSCSHVWLATENDVFDSVEDIEAAEDIETENELLATDDDQNLEAEDSQSIPAVSPFDEDPLEELDFEEIEDESLDEEVSQSDLDDLFDEPSPETVVAEEENSQGDIDNLFDEAADDEVSEDNSQDDIDGLFDEPAEENSQSDVDGLFDEPSEDNSQDDIDGLFDDEPKPEPDPDPVSEDLTDPFDTPMEDIVPEPEEEPALEIAAQSTLPFWKQMDRKVMIGWGCYGLVVVMLTTVMVLARVSVVRTIPSMAGVYAALGMPVNVRGLIFTNVQQRWEVEDNRLFLKINGEITNLTNKYKTLPPVVFGAKASASRVVFRWVMTVRKKPLLPGETAPFTAKVPLPPKRSKYLFVSFEK